MVEVEQEENEWGEFLSVIQMGVGKTLRRLSLALPRKPNVPIFRELCVCRHCKRVV
jgi:hypothetical protein